MEGSRDGKVTEAVKGLIWDKDGSETGRREG